MQNNSLFLKDKKILITGGAGKIGLASAISISNAGGIPILIDISEKGLIKASEVLKDKIHYCLNIDLNTSEVIENAIKEIFIEHDYIDSAIYASYPRSKGWGQPIENLKEEFLFQDLNLQLGIAIMFSKIIIKHFKEQGKGSLIHISSIQGINAPKFEHYEGTKMTSPIEYSAIKAGIISITKWLAKYYKNMNIRVNCVSPGGILDKQPEIFLTRYRKDCSNIGMLSGSDIGDVISFLLSDAAKGINGQNIIIDDGWSL